MPSVRFLFSTVLALLACAAPSAQAAVEPPVSDLFVVKAAHGSLTPLRGADRFVLELRDVERQTTWFTDRPQRAAGTHSTASFFAGWAELGFEADAPNAAIALAGGHKGADTLIVELGTPRYDAKTRTLRMKVRRLGTDATVRSGHERRADRRLPRRFGAVSLFVDSAVPRTVTLHVINDTGFPVKIAFGSTMNGRFLGCCSTGPLTDLAPHSSGTYVAAETAANRGFSGSFAVVSDAGSIDFGWQLLENSTSPSCSLEAFRTATIARSNPVVSSGPSPGCTVLLRDARSAS